MGKTREISNKIDDIVNVFDNGEMNVVANTANKLETPVNIAGVSFDGSSSISIPFDNLSSKPNTVSGFGITDAYTKSEVNTAISAATPTFETILEKPNTISGYGITDAYTKTQTDTAIANLVNSAPVTLDTLNELATALGNDANFSTTVATNIGNVSSNLSSHTSSTSNPHSVTASQVGLGNVNNTSDANKPISTATQTALNLKADSSTVSAHTGNTSNPHGTTAAQIGLGNVENKSSATIRGEITSGNVTTALGYTPYNNTNPSGFITGINSSMVTTALGYTPQNSSTAITTSNIGSQSVNYASSAGSSSTASTANALNTSNNYQMNSVGVGTGATGTAGQIVATNNITAYYSDARLKDFKGTITNALEKVLQLNGYYFVENETAKELGYNNDRLQVGVSAQEVEAVLPEVITEAPINNLYKTVWYDKMIPLLIEAIKEQQKQIDELKNKECESLVSKSLEV